MKDKKNIIIAVLGVVCVVLLILLLTTKKDVITQNCDNKESDNISTVNTIYTCTKEQDLEDGNKITLKLILETDNTGAITKFFNGTINKFETQEEYESTKTWMNENGYSYDELGDNTLYSYTDMSNEYSDDWYKTIMNFYLSDGYTCTNN